MSTENIIHVTDSNWKTDVLDSTIPVLVDFWAQWCGPCRAIAPVLEELATELTGKVAVAKVDVDDNQKLASEFGVRSIPTLLIMKGGVVQEQMVGAMNKDALKKKLEPYL